MPSSSSSALRLGAIVLATTSSFFAILSACSTDNGDNTHGPDVQFPKKDATTIDGKTVLPDGAVVEPEDDSGGGKQDGSSGGLDPDTGVPCLSGTIAVLAGNDTALGGSIQEKSGAWNTGAIANGAAKSKPALVQFGTGFLGVTHGAGDALQSTSANGTTWSAAASFGNAGVKGPPTLAIVGTQAHVVYSAGAGANRDFAHAIHDGTNFNAGTAQVGPPLSFGTVSAGLAGAGADAVFAENGSDEGLYVRSFTGGAWAAAAGVVGAGTVGSSLPATPELVGLDGAKWDLLLVYVEKTTRFISFAMRDANTKVWADGDSVGNAVTTNEKLSLSRVGQFTVLVTFRGQDGKGYYTQGSVNANNINWSAAAPIGGGAAFAVDSTPSAAKGVCGDDAVVAYASGGSVSITRLRGASWTTPEAVTNLSGSRVAIATKP
jgi:hypothetical protein